MNICAFSFHRKSQSRPRELFGMPYSDGVSLAAAASGTSTPMSWIVTVSPFVNRSSNVSPSITRVIVPVRVVGSEPFVSGGVTESAGGVFVGTVVVVGFVVAVSVLVCAVAVGIGVMAVGTVVGIGVDVFAGDVSIEDDVFDDAVAAVVVGVDGGFGDVVGCTFDVVAVVGRGFGGVVVVGADFDVDECVTVCTAVFSSFTRLIVIWLTDSPSTDEIESALPSLVFSDTTLSDVDVVFCFGVQLTRTVRFIESLTAELAAVIRTTIGTPSTGLLQCTDAITGAEAPLSSLNGVLLTLIFK